MSPTALPALLLALAACRADGACGPGGPGPVDPDRDPVEFLADYAGPSFSELQDVEADGDVVWFCTGVQGLNAYDASDPTRLRKLDAITPSLGSQVYPRCQHLAVAPDRTVYVSNRGDSIQPQPFIAAIDGDDPSRLRERRVAAMDDEVEGLTVHGAHLWVAAHDGGLLVLDRDTLRVVGRATEGLANAWQVRASGDVAWVADGAGGLVSVDLSDPTRPAVLGAVDLPGQAKDLEVDGDRAWVALGSEGVAVVDIADPAAPKLLDRQDTPGSALGVALSRPRGGLVVADWNDLRLFDVSDRDRLVARGHEPLLLRSDLGSRTLGVATGRHDLVFSGNWTALSSYRLHLGRHGGDLDPRPAALTLPRTEPGDVTNALIDLVNAGDRPLRLTGSQVGGRGLEVELAPATLAPGDKVVARARWTPAGNGALDGWVNVLSDDPDEPRKCVPISGNQAGLTVGDPIGDPSFVGIDGTPIHLSDYEGQVVLLAYFATF